eukprot:m.11357 g.11357  ORF g.11357 m.11357 type:complete len:97 (+) comp23202_c0_seq1:319-609(+)
MWTHGGLTGTLTSSAMFSNTGIGEERSQRYFAHAKTKELVKWNKKEAFVALSSLKLPKLLQSDLYKSNLFNLDTFPHHFLVYKLENTNFNATLDRI